MRRWAWVVVLVAGMAHAEREYAFGGPEPVPPKPETPERAARFAAGSARGPWTFQEFGAYVGTGTFVRPELFALAGLTSSAVFGWGFDVGPVHLRPSVRTGWGLSLAPSDPETTPLTHGPLSVRLAATNLLDEPRTGLRLTPIVGLTVPLPGFDPREDPLTTLLVALQLERRFGPVELAVRGDVGKPASAPEASRGVFGVDWWWSATALVEGWILDSLSAGASFSWQSTQVFSSIDPLLGGRPTFINQTVGRLFLSWAFARLFGVTLETQTVRRPFDPNTGQFRFPFLSFGAWADNSTVVLVSLWFRSDVTLQRNWLER